MIWFLKWWSMFPIHHSFEFRIWMRKWIPSGNQAWCARKYPIYSSMMVPFQMRNLMAILQLAASRVWGQGRVPLALSWPLKATEENLGGTDDAYEFWSQRLTEDCKYHASNKVGDRQSDPIQRTGKIHTTNFWSLLVISQFPFLRGQLTDFGRCF